MGGIIGGTGFDGVLSDFAVKNVLHPDNPPVPHSVPHNVSSTNDRISASFQAVCYRNILAEHGRYLNQL
ncbi:MAG: hypothetical protein OYH77_07735 [Pseudomonadota bacterium]|nr:hypothetical protein [Pseudomonadota bacterium]